MIRVVEDLFWIFLILITPFCDWIKSLPYSELITGEEE